MWLVFTRTRRGDFNLVPAQLENDMEAFVRGYAEHSKLDVYSKGIISLASMVAVILGNR